MRAVSFPTLLGAYIASLLLVAGGLTLYWSDRSVRRAAMEEARQTFHQRQIIIGAILDRELDNLGHFLHTAQSSPSLLAGIAGADSPTADAALEGFAQGLQPRRPDILLLVREGKAAASASAPEAEAILPLIARDARQRPSPVCRYVQHDTDVSVLLDAVHLVDREGQVLGILMCGTILDHNLRLMNRIIEQTGATTAVWVDGDKFVAQGGSAKDEGNVRLLKRHMQSRQSENISIVGRCFVNDQALLVADFPTRITTVLAVPDQTAPHRETAFRNHLLALLGGAFLILLVSILGIRRLVRPELRRLINYAAGAVRQPQTPPYANGRMEEFNWLGRSIEGAIEHLRAANEEMRNRIAERDQTLRHLCDRQQRQQAILDAANVAIVSCDRQRHVLSMNRPAERLLDVRVCNVKGKPLSDVLPLRPVKGHMAPADGVEHVFTYNTPLSSDHYQLALSGRHLRRVSVRFTPVQDEAGDPDGAIVALADITDRCEMEEALRASELRLRQIYNASDDGIAILGKDGERILDVNESLLALLGTSREELLSRPAALCPEGEPPAREALGVQIRRAMLGEPQRFSSNMRRSDGSVLCAEIELKGMALDGVPCVMAVIRDQDARQRAETAPPTSRQNGLPIQASADAIAHEMSNLLGGILGAAELLQMRTPADAPQQKYLSILSETTLRASELNERLRSLAQGQTPPPSPPTALMQPAQTSPAHASPTGGVCRGAPHQPEGVQENTQECEGLFNGTALLIDDETVIRTIGERMLSDLGFTVLLAENGKEGVELFRRHQDEIVLVILDMVMPVMNGEDTFNAIRAIRPRQKIILSSGYTRNVGVNTLLEQGLAGFVKKPFRLAALRELIGTVLSA